MIEGKNGEILIIKIQRGRERERERENVRERERVCDEIVCEARVKSESTHFEDKEFIW